MMPNFGGGSGGGTFTNPVQKPSLPQAPQPPMGNNTGIVGPMHNGIGPSPNFHHNMMNPNHPNMPGPMNPAGNPRMGMPFNSGSNLGGSQGAFKFKPNMGMSPNNGMGPAGMPMDSNGYNFTSGSIGGPSNGGGLADANGYNFGSASGAGPSPQIMQMIAGMAQQGGNQQYPWMQNNPGMSRVMRTNGM